MTAKEACNTETLASKKCVGVLINKSRAWRGCGGRFLGDCSANSMSEAAGDEPKAEDPVIEPEPTTSATESAESSAPVAKADGEEANDTSTAAAGSATSTDEPQNTGTGGSNVH